MRSAAYLSRYGYLLYFEIYKIENGVGSRVKEEQKMES